MTSRILTRTAATLAAGFAAAAVFLAPANAAAVPVAVDDAYAVVAGRTLTVAAPGVLGNDSEKPDGAVAAKGPENPDGFVLQFNGSFTYTPPVYVSGIITVTYCVSTPTIPPSCLSTYASIRITVTGPATVPDAYTVVAGQTLTVPAPGVLANDLNTTAGSQVAAGQSNGGPNPILDDNGALTWTPAINAAGVHTFKYCIKRPGTQPPACITDYATFTITVTGPQATDDAYTVPAGMFYSIAPSLGVLSNDINVPPGTIASWQQPPPAGLTLGDDGGITWAVPSTPGVYTFPYCILAFPADPGRRSCVSQNATVTLTVATPVAVNDAYVVDPGASLTVPAPGVLGNDTGIPTGTIASWQQPPPTGLTLSGDGSIIWTAPTTPGTFTFPYCIVAFADSPQHRCVSNNATITVTVTAPSTTPAAPADPNLPQTGTSIWMIVATGLVLTGAGAYVVILARRRA